MEQNLNVAPIDEQATKSALTTSIVGLVLASLGLPGWIVSAIARGKCKKLVEGGEPVVGKLKVANILSKIGLPVSIVVTILYVVEFILGIVIGVMQMQNM